MSELRKDPILGFWVVINEKRGERPRQFKKPEVVHEDKDCYFCLGNEGTTPAEIGRVEENGKWKMRWFDNKFPIFKHEEDVSAAQAIVSGKAAETGLAGKPINASATGKPQKINKAGKKKEDYERMDGFGYHEVVVDTNDHSKQMWDLEPADILELLKVYCGRIKELSKQKDVSYVMVFKNHGVEGGTSIVHSHTQIITTPFLPSRVEEEIKAVKKAKKCPFCNMVSVDGQVKKGTKQQVKPERYVAENNNFVAITPYASRFNYEVWILSKKHEREFVKFDDGKLVDLAEMLHLILMKLKELDCSFNFFLHYAPIGFGADDGKSAGKAKTAKGKKDLHDLHFHIEITPRKATWAGFELGTDIVVNSVSPESAARFYRGEEETPK